MAAPTTYTEEELKAYMHSLVTNDDKVNELVTTLKWNVANGSYDEAVNETLLTYGADTISSISGRENIRKLRVAARMELWRLVVQRTVQTYQKSDGGQLTISYQQIWEHAKTMFEFAQADAVALGIEVSAAYEVGKTAVRYALDPYHYALDTDNEWSRVD